MGKTIFQHLLLLLAIILAGTGQVFAETVDGYLKGDANGDNSVSVSDAVVVIQKFHDSKKNPSCPINADANGDGVINVSDAVVIIAMFHYGALNATGTISGWTEGNDNPDELLPMQGDSEEDDSYGD